MTRVNIILGSLLCSSRSLATIYVSAAANSSTTLPYRRKLVINVLTYCHPLLFFHVYVPAFATVDYYLDLSTGRYFVEVPPEEDDDEDFSQ